MMTRTTSTLGKALFDEAIKQVKVLGLIKSNKKIEYYNSTFSFDIETTSFERDGSKQATMYVWQFSINNITFYGRTWTEFNLFCEAMQEALELNDKSKRIIVYVHNLAFEFQFLRFQQIFTKVFAVAKREPVYAINEYGIEYRCSYILSGYSLQALAGKLQYIKLDKLVGDLDYALLRHSKTELTDKELMYCRNDVLIVTSYIAELMAQNRNNISYLPITKTGFVRKYCRNKCLYDGVHRKNTKKFLDYKKIMQRLTLTVDEYKQAKRVFQGGFTHANAFKSCKVYEDVASFDETSAYPAVMVLERFPMSTGEEVRPKDKAEFYKYLQYYCCMFDIEIFDLESKITFENYISKSRCIDYTNICENNGRIWSADYICMSMTELDFKIISRCYNFSKIRIHNMRVYKKDYLPRDFVLSILDLYEAKTTLKGVQGREVDYQQSKERINACYGMAVTDICRDEITYDSGVWGEVVPDINKAINKYNKSNNRFLSYLWGVWVTAYARYNLWTAITACKTDYIYSDTDSVKILNKDKHIPYFKGYNEMIIKKIEYVSKLRDIPKSKFMPRTIKGDVKIIGQWDYEGTYSKFKTLGAKRYMVEEDGKVNITVAGLNKRQAVPYLIDMYGDDVFNAFSNHMYIPIDHTGKLTHTYIDEPISGELTDYQGVTAKYFEGSCIHLSKQDYDLSISAQYADFLKNVTTYRH